MNKIRIVPTVLFNNFSIVKGENFESWRTVGNIIQIIKIYSLREVDELIFFDISASKNNKKVDFEIVDEFADHCFMPLTVGGGISSLEDIDKLLKVGADKVAINTHAFLNPKLIERAVSKFGSQCIVVGVDYKKNSKGKNEVYIKSGSETTKVELFEYLKKVKALNPGEIVLTSINHDGTMKGYDIETFIKAKKILDMPIVASGGCGNYQHMADLLKKCSISALSAASMYHFTEQTPLGAKKFLKEKGFRVRL